MNIISGSMKIGFLSNKDKVNPTNGETRPAVRKSEYEGKPQALATIMLKPEQIKRSAASRYSALLASFEVRDLPMLRSIVNILEGRE